MIGAREEDHMIARIWHGMTPIEKAASYTSFLNERAIPDYQSTPGNLAVYILRREQGTKCHFLTLTFWESVQAIQAFAGTPIERAKYYPEDSDFLLEFEPNVTHWEVTGSAKC
jgi:heme-degrading monooxygenase HmoA